MREQRGSASRAAIGVAFGMAVLAFGLSTTEPAPCTRPVEVEALTRWSVVARCDLAEDDREELRGPARLLFGHPLDLNLAEARELEVLPGIGPSRAAAILRYRAQHPFRSLDELTQVHGIGPVTVAGVRGLLRVVPEMRPSVAEEGV